MDCQKSYICTVKIVVQGNPTQNIKGKHNNLPLLSLASNALHALLLNAVFYCAVVFLIQPDSFRNYRTKISVSNPPFRGRERASNDVRLSTGDQHAKVHTAEWAKIERVLRGYRTKWQNWKVGNLYLCLSLIKCQYPYMLGRSACAL